MLLPLLPLFLAVQVQHVTDQHIKEVDKVRKV